MDIFKVLYENEDKEKAFNMAKYMKNQFDFLGINKPELKKLKENTLKKSKTKNILIMIL